MFRKLAPLGIILMLSTGVLACTADAVPQTVDDVPRISVEELKAEMEKGAVTVIDVRGPTSYASIHMTGAINIPELDVQSRAGELSGDGLIVTYCT